MPPVTLCLNKDLGIIQSVDYQVVMLVYIVAILNNTDLLRDTWQRHERTDPSQVNCPYNKERLTFIQICAQAE